MQPARQTLLGYSTNAKLKTSTRWIGGGGASDYSGLDYSTAAAGESVVFKGPARGGLSESRGKRVGLCR